MGIAHLALRARIEDSNDEKETDMTGLSPFLPLDSSLMNEASILIEELSFNFEKDQEDNEEIVEEKMEEENQSREEKSEQDLSGKEKLEENQSGEGKEEQSVEEKLEEHESGEEKEELSGEEKEELSGEEKLEEKQKSKKKNRFSVGEHVKVTFGKEDFPAIVTDLDDSGVWGQFFRRKGASGWALDDIKYFIVQKDILKSLTPPDLVPLGGSRFSYKFEDF
ncbi:CHD7 [Mytilus edulis]|uniref:CHD7 n=1 Tax=Mytilus edulis TaxID=6550 RepID=A0A8S3QNT3_MYTED|nr:CHD7 [Mytilus edulis]